MNTDKLIAAEELAGRLKMAVEGIKKKPGLMKSSVGLTKGGKYERYQDERYQYEH